MQHVQIINLTRPLATPLSAKYCNSFLCQLRGLTFRRAIGEKEGLLLVQKNESIISASIHMLWMWFDITAVWIDSQNRVVDVKIARRWSPAYFPAHPAKYVLETHSGRFEDFCVGETIQFQPL